jgi:hypothetical protein
MTTAAIDAATDAPTAPLTPGGLEAALRAVEPGVVLLPRWLLQNVIAADRGRGGSPFTVPHRKIHLIARQKLLAVAAEEALAIPDDLPSVEQLTLLPRPHGDWIAAQSAAQVLRHYWRLLFHARVDAQMRQRLAGCDDAEVQAQIDRLGRAEFNEAEVVLTKERYLPAGAGPREVYAEFVAVYLELQAFRPDLLAAYFPAVIATGVSPVAGLEADARVWCEQARPHGAADVTPPPTEAHVEAGDEPQPPRLTPARAQRLLARARRATAAGNVARAGILRTRVFRAFPQDKVPNLEASCDLDALAKRLQTALELSDAVAHRWRTMLDALLPRASLGWWTREARLLYDLQKACIDQEREIYSVGVVDWLLERCRRPLRRPQPNQRRVLMIKSLRSALRRAGRVRLPAAQRARLTHLLHDALHHADGHLRDTLRPAIAQSLEAGGLHPHSAVERVAEAKLVDDLLDSISHRGYLTLGNVRDAISQNQLKLHDIPRFGAFFGGDQLLRVDRQLARSLDAVYHRGEIYLRFFQRASSLLFATPWGRLLTLTVLLPIGGAFVILEAFDHTLFLLLRKLTGWHWLKVSRLEEFKAEPFGRALLANLPFILLALTLLGALNWPPFRGAVVRGLKGLGHLLGAVFIDAPRWLATRPWVQRLARSRAVRLTARYGLKPLVFAALASLFVPRAAGPTARGIMLAAAFAAANVLLNSRGGRALEQAVLQWLRVAGARFTSDVLLNLLRGIAHFFQRMLEYFDRALYAVDEWLRFRAGQGGASLIAKASLGVVWFYIAYFSRFAVNLLVEPQINPIKHFPVVTVSHKIVLPTVGLFASALEQLGVRTVRARTLAAGIVTVIPGIFGFLAWELRANWKLYRANRPRTLRPVQIGSHGETLARLLRPGFHSGTVPKLFARLRRAQRHLGNPFRGRFFARAEASVHKQLEAAEHVREAVAHFIEREFIALLEQHPAWRDAPVSLGPVEIGVTRVDVELACPAVDDSATARIVFEQRGGQILAGLEPAGWMERTEGERRASLSAALQGLYALAGVDVVREQGASTEPARPPIAWEAWVRQWEPGAGLPPLTRSHVL